MKNLELLGYRVTEKVTGLSGVVTSITFDLYGCVQALVHPGLDKDGKPLDQVWFDVNRLQILEGDPVMPNPHVSEGRDKGGNCPPLTSAR